MTHASNTNAMGYLTKKTVVVIARTEINDRPANEERCIQTPISIQHKNLHNSRCDIGRKHLKETVVLPQRSTAYFEWNIEMLQRPSTKNCGYTGLEDKTVGSVIGEVFMHLKYSTMSPRQAACVRTSVRVVELWDSAHWPIPNNWVYIHGALAGDGGTVQVIEWYRFNSI
ncbi:hypothetical protein K435DRAFT_812091 [Dendrothele bispora CBS 962.96]|uniref:Uncharacterized protein n=1 Tax=Dendrothele bispora (strain CBS 962.96) TaxID=1314807 RepID=A0A4S8KQ33_DENBC|nr:hypothetical protein K435DRAFT_812597 [Dendrothele bispora CBS 962.96]THU77834.1 hypothetical protein K435DRAFT_812091 [Dendrothele bispora CBS 962.96]